MPKYINADALLAEAKRLSGPMTGDGWSNWGVYALIERQPTADVAEVRRGRWTDCGSLSCRCSECGCKNSRETSFCPNCGAKMDGGGPHES